MTVSILGCGWFGWHFAKVLISSGHRVKGSTTKPEKLPLLEKDGIEPFLIDLSNFNPQSTDPAFFYCDVFVVAIPPKVRSRPRAQYMSEIKLLVDWLKSHQVKNVIYISSTGVYEDSNRRVDETVVPRPESQSGQALQDAELLLKSTETFATTIVRFGGLIGPGRDPANFHSGKSAVPNGRAPVNLIHLNDCSGICLAILRHQAFGYVFNACALEHPMKQQFYTMAAHRSGLKAPYFVDELLDWKIVESVYLDSILSYKFSHSLSDLKF